MTVKYEWKINNIKTKKNEKNEDIVSEIYWSKTGKDASGVVGFFEGVVQAETVPVLEGETPKFIPYAKLKETDVLNWVKKVVVSYEAHVDNTIQKQIDEQNKVLVDTPLPWAKPEK